jgi:hypothetical protein
MTMKSSIQLLGLPLVHVTTGQLVDGRYRRGVARGWIAVGDVAFGFSSRLEVLAVGGISIGGLALGGLAFAGVAIGGFALGGLAIGVAAVGGAALAWSAAVGGLAIARDVALGGLAIATHANDAVARELATGQTFFRVGTGVAKYSRWLSLLVVLPVIMLLRQRRGAESDRGIHR